jgi:hypothetical protein
MLNRFDEARATARLYIDSTNLDRVSQSTIVDGGLERLQRRCFLIKKTKFPSLNFKSQALRRVINHFWTGIDRLPRHGSPWSSYELTATEGDVRFTRLSAFWIKRKQALTCTPIECTVNSATSDLSIIRPQGVENNSHVTCPRRLVKMSSRQWREVL